MENTKYCMIKFKYIDENSKEEDIRVVGNNEILGNWEPNKAVKLTQSKKHFGVWKTLNYIKIPLLCQL